MVERVGAAASVRMRRAFRSRPHLDGGIRGDKEVGEVGDVTLRADEDGGDVEASRRVLRWREDGGGAEDGERAGDKVLDAEVAVGVHRNGNGDGEEAIGAALVWGVQQRAIGQVKVSYLHAGLSRAPDVGGSGLDVLIPRRVLHNHQAHAAAGAVATGHV